MPCAFINNSQQRRREKEDKRYAQKNVREQLKKIGGMEFYDVHFSYIDNDTLEERFVSVPEHGGGSLIHEGPMKPGTMHTVAFGTLGAWGFTGWNYR